MSLLSILPREGLWVRKLKWPKPKLSPKNVRFDPSPLLGFNINMKPNEAQCEENQGVRGEKIPPPISEFGNPGRPPEFSQLRIWELVADFDRLI